MNKTGIRCPICKNPVSLFEEVNLDILNTVTHQSCDFGSAMRLIEIKNAGTFEEMIDKYPLLGPVLV